MSKKETGNYSLSPARRGKACGVARKSPARHKPRGTFGDLCEMSDGLAVVWRRNGCTEREMWAFATDDPSILRDVVPALHALGFGEDDVVRHVPHDGPLACLLLGFYLIAVAHIALHEAGHGVFGALCGSRFVSYRVFGLMWIRREDERG